jgi:hypothetical protein
MGTGDDDYFTIEGPIELHGDRLALRIPMEVGGQSLAPMVRDSDPVEEGFRGFVEGDWLVVLLEPQLTDRLNVSVGDRVTVDCFNARFNVTRSGELVHVEQRIELHGGDMAVFIPLEAGGEIFAPMIKRNATIENGVLIIVLPPWLTELLKVAVGSLVVVHNRNGLFNLTRSSANDA